MRNKLQMGALQPLPLRYEIIKFLGEGGYAIVLQCFDSHTKKDVAVKFAKGKNKFNHEAAMMKFLMKCNLDQQNIIKFHNTFSSDQCLVFEMCDISLKDYINPQLDVEDIRTVIQQLATALDALKNFGVIHSDLKTNNIMLVDQKRKPLKVKLIDFGLAIFTHQANHTINRCLYYKAPELILGLPYSTALDIWSLGCVMAKMLFNCVLFPGNNEYENLCYFVDLLGPPPDHLVAAGKKSTQFFRKTDSNQWILKTPVEYWREEQHQNKKYLMNHLMRHVKMINLKFKELETTDERKECLALLKAMLQWDAEKRITPKGILNNSFIIRSKKNTSSSFQGPTPALGQEHITSEAGSSSNLTDPTSTGQEIQFVNSLVRLHRERKTYIADQPRDFDKDLPPLPKIKEAPCAHLEHAATVSRLPPGNTDREKHTTATSSKTTIKQEELGPAADVKPTTTTDNYSQATTTCNKPKQKKNFLKKIFHCWGLQ